MININLPINKWIQSLLNFYYGKQHFLYDATKVYAVLQCKKIQKSMNDLVRKLNTDEGENL